MRGKRDRDRSHSPHEKKHNKLKKEHAPKMGLRPSRDTSLGSEVRASVSCRRLAPSDCSDSDASFETVIIVRSRSRSRNPKHEARVPKGRDADSKEGKHSASEATDKSKLKHAEKSPDYNWDQVTLRSPSKKEKGKHSNHADEKSRNPDHSHSDHRKKKPNSETTLKSDTHKSVKQHSRGRSRSHSRNSRGAANVRHDKSKHSERSASSSSADPRRARSSSGQRERSKSRSHSAARHTDDERNKSQTREARKSSAGVKAHSRGSSQHSKQERHRQSSHSSSSMDSYASDKTPRSDAHRRRSRSRRGVHKLPAVLTFLDLENYFLFTDPHSQNESASDSESRIEKKVSFKQRSINSSSTQRSHSEPRSHSGSRGREPSYSHSESISESDAPYFSESESFASESSHSHRSSSESNFANQSARCNCRKGEGYNGTFKRILEDSKSNSSCSEEEMHPSDSCSNVSSSDRQSESHFSDSFSESSGSTPRASRGKEKSVRADHDELPSIASIHRYHDSDPGSGEIIIPTNMLRRDSKIPAQEISLEFIHGYRSKDVSNNAYYLNEHTIIFPAGSIGVVMCLKTNTQRFFQGRHKQEISALCIHPSKNLVATGDAISTSESCYIYVWDPKEPEDVQRMVQIRVGDRKLAGGVIDAQFSCCGKFLAAVSMDLNHHVYVYNWQKAGKLVAKESGHKHVIFGLCFNPLVSHEFITFGVRHVTFWKMDVPKGQLCSVQGVFRTDEIPSILSSAYLPNAQLLTGTQRGQVLLWEKHQIVKVIELAAQVEVGPVLSINTSSKLGVLVGGKDGILVRLDTNSLETIASMKTPSAIKSLDASGHGKVLVGFEGSELIEITELSGKDAVLQKGVARTLLQGHSVSQNDKLRACATNPTNECEYCTVGDDSAVYVRNLKSKATVAKTYLQGKLRAASYSPDGKYISVGNSNGDIFIVKSNDLAQAHFQKYEKRDDVKTNFHAINVIKFSPNGKYLAAGSSDHVVYLFELSDGFKKTHTFRGHSGGVMCLDWSVRSDFLRSDSGAERIHWSISNGAQAKLDKTVEWSSWTCVGLVSHNRNDDVNACCRSPNKEIVISGTSAGILTLKTFPSDHLVHLIGLLLLFGVLY
ncbi:Echinoderm microtubule-associated protein-like 5 [Chytriomyces hyalinus]|nr:Echinoderm microtubule-associated protein-like 5 [Chytriomyces hyalinus]